MIEGSVRWISHSYIDSDTACKLAASSSAWPNVGP